MASDLLDTERLSVEAGFATKELTAPLRASERAVTSTWSEVAIGRLGQRLGDFGASIVTVHRRSDALRSAEEPGQNEQRPPVRAAVDIEIVVDEQ